MLKKLANLSAIILINLLIVAILLEILLRVFAPSLPGTVGIAARYVTTGQPYQQEWTPAWEQNRAHYWVLRPGIDDALQYGSPSVSFRMSTTALWEGSIGFRTDPVDYFVDAVVVGDSFGMCFTERADCWVDQLAAQSNLGIVNLSQPVTGTTSHYRILRDYGVPLLETNSQPLVIWQFFGNDFNDDYGLAVFSDEIEPLEPENTGATEASPPPSALYAVLQTLLTGNIVGVPDSEALFVKPYRALVGDELLRFGGAYELQALDMSRDLNQIGLDYSREAFLSAQQIVDDMNGNLLVVIIPTREEVYRESTAPIMGEDAVATLQSARDTMLALCDDLALTCFDAYDTLRAAAQESDTLLYYSDDMHLNAAGNAILADALANYLAD